MISDPTSLEHWFPVIEAAGLPVPKTIILEMPEAAKRDVWKVFGGERAGDAVIRFANEIAEKATALGIPFFLRTNETSGKHNWKRTCMVLDPANLLDHVLALAEYSEMVSILGLPWHTWVLRELLPTIPFGVCPGYGDMPVCREFRFFVRDGEVECWHPYWPHGALMQGGAENIDYEALCAMPDEPALRDLATRVGRAISGYWSVDLLETRRGWFVTDMAEGEKSYHWPGCARQLTAEVVI